MKLLYNTKIEFRSGRLLTAEMMELLQRQSLQCWKLFDDAPDGILKGLLFEMRDGQFWITKGLVKLENAVYELPEDISFQSLKEDFPSNDGMIVIIPAEPERVAQSLIHECVQIQILEIGQEISVPHILIGAFHQSNGATLKLCSPATNDVKEHLENMLSIKNGCFSFPYCHYILNSELTFHPLVFSWIRQMLEEKAEKTTMEYTLLMMLYQSPVLAVDVLKTYVRRYAENPDSSEWQSLEGADLLRKVIFTIETAKEIFAVSEKPKEKTEVKKIGRIL